MKNIPIIYSWPPNIARIEAVFGKLPDTAIFAYGDRIYHPGGTSLPPEKLAHEAVHLAQQAVIGLKEWWEMYLRSDIFRLQQEIPALRADYRSFCERYKDRNEQTRYAHHLAAELSGPLYGNIIDRSTALNKIRI